MFLVAEFAKDVILVLPVLADLDPEVEIDRSAQDLLQFPCRILLGRLQEASVLSDDDTLLRRAFHVDRAADVNASVFLFAEFFRINADRMRHFIPGADEELFADDFLRDISFRLVSDHVVREVLRPFRQVLFDRIHQFVKVVAYLCGNRDNVSEIVETAVLRNLQEKLFLRDEVNLGKDAILNGAVAQTETIHTDAINYTSKVLPEGTSAEDAGQLTSFTIAEYYDIGHVANRFYSNGDNTLAVNLDDNAQWNITGDCLLSSLTIGDNASVQGADGTVEMTVDGTPTELTPGTYEGEIRISYTENEPAPAASSAEEAAASESSVAPDEAASEVPEATEAPASADAPVETTEAPAETSGLSGGAIAGIVIAILAVIAVIVAVVKKKKK